MDKDCSNFSYTLVAIVTMHCLLGCSIGEVLGLVIGVTLNMNSLNIMLLATMLAFIFGMLMASSSVSSRQNISIINAMKIVFIGEIVSISAMELAMNGVDYYYGGINATSIFSGVFIKGLILSIPAGYFAALPVNYILLKYGLKKCHV